MSHFERNYAHQVIIVQTCIYFVNNLLSDLQPKGENLTELNKLTFFNIFGSNVKLKISALEPPGNIDKICTVFLTLIRYFRNSKLKFKYIYIKKQHLMLHPSHIIFLQLTQLSF